MPFLLDMPDVVMNLILDKLDFRSIQNLRKSCRDLLHCIDEAKPESNVTELFITIWKDIIHFLIRFEKGGAIIDYWKKDGLISYSGSSGLKKQKFFKSSNFLDIAIRDLKSILDSKTSDSFKFLEIDLKLREETTEQFSESLIKILDSRPLIKATKLKMIVNSSDQVSNFLKYSNPRNLKKFELRVDGNNMVENFDFSKIVELPQWKSLTEFVSENFYVKVPTESLTNFERISIYVKEVTLDMVLELKEIFLSNPNPTSFEIRHLFFKKEVLQTFGELFGDPYKHENRFGGQYYFRVPGDSDCQKIHGISYNECYFKFNRIYEEEVSTGAVIS